MNHWAVVTGASSGLGREFARALAGRGHRVLAIARRGDRLVALREEVKLVGGRVEPLVADLSTSAGIDAVLAKAATLEVELLVNNAGFATYGPFAALSLERERELVRINVEAIVAITRGLLPAMIERKRGGVINVGSQMGFQATPFFASYSASKAFVLSFSEAIAEELRGTGVDVTAVMPGFVTTEFSEVAGSSAAVRRFPHLESRSVVEKALKAHERGRTVKGIGAFYSLLSVMGQLSPGPAQRRVMARMMRP
jgi:short-subunit dehydrogenase